MTEHAPARPTPDDIEAAATRLREGGVVAFPTETVYGLAADARSADAVRALYAIKGRPSTKPLTLHVSDETMATRYVGKWPPRAHELARRYWPGPLTIIVPKGTDLPDEVTAGGATIGVRCPDHPVALDLIRAFGAPVVAPSANRSGQLPPTRPEHVRAAFDDRDVLVLDAGACPGGLESTVLLLAGESGRERILRRGPITPQDLNLPDDAVPPPAKPPHASSDTGAIAIAISPTEAQARCRNSGAKHAAIIAHDAGWLDKAARGSDAILLPDDPFACAARLYDALHEARRRGAGLIIVQWPTSPGPIWDAIRDRLAALAAGADG